MLALFVGLLVLNLISGTTNLISFGKTGNPFSGFVGAGCMFAGGAVLMIVVLKSSGILP